MCTALFSMAKNKNEKKALALPVLEPTSLLGIFTISQFPGTVHLWENEGSNNVAICQSNISDAFLRPGTSSVSPVMVAAGTSDDTVLYRD